MIHKDKSAAQSKAGNALTTVSGVVLFFGIVSAIIIFIASFRSEWNGLYHETSFDWTGLASAIEVLFGSIFIYIFGKTIARIANYAEAIYKQQNPDYKYDRFIEKGAYYLPGEEVMYKDDNTEQKVIIKEITDDDGYNLYHCLFPDGEIKKIRLHYLHDIKQ